MIGVAHAVAIYVHQLHVRLQLIACQRLAQPLEGQPKLHTRACKFRNQLRCFSDYLVFDVFQLEATILILSIHFFVQKAHEHTQIIEFMCALIELYADADRANIRPHRLWKCMSSDMYLDRKENKNVGTFVFVQLYIISQHCLRHFKSHGFSLKLLFCHNHKCCPRSEVSLPGKRISPIRRAVREREYYC